MPACEHCEAVSRKPLLRASTEENTLERAAGSGADGPSRKALVTEKSHASGRPLGPLGTQTSAGRREEEERSRWIRVGRAITIQWVAGNQEARFFQDSTKPGLEVGSRVNDITNHVVTDNSIPPQLQTNQCVIPPFVHDLSAEGAVGILGPNRHT